MLALTSADTTNLEAALYGRSIKSDLRVALRLYDDDFATAVYRTLRAAHPRALTRSRSVSHLAAPAFAGAMMGRQILGAIPVERTVLLFAAVQVAGLPQLEGRTVAEAFSSGAWRLLALDTATEDRRSDLSATRADDDDDGAGRGRGAGRPPRLVWDLHPGYVLRSDDRVVLAATRRASPKSSAVRPRRAPTRRRAEASARPQGEQHDDEQDQQRPAEHPDLPSPRVASLVPCADFVRSVVSHGSPAYDLTPRSCRPLYGSSGPAHRSRRATPGVLPCSGNLYALSMPEGHVKESSTARQEASGIRGSA